MYFSGFIRRRIFILNDRRGVTNQFFKNSVLLKIGGKVCLINKLNHKLNIGLVLL